MPFDGTDFQSGRKRKRQTPGERAFGIIFLVCAISLLVMPISAAALIDIVHYLWGVAPG